MKSVGLTEVLVIVGLIVFFWGLPRLGPRRGRDVRSEAESRFGGRLMGWRWLYYYLGGGSEAKKIEAEEAFGRHLAHTVPAGSVPQAQAAAARRVGNCLAMLVPSRHFAFTVVDSAEVNAFALPGGRIFVTNRLMKAVDGDEHGLAFVLAHEMGHVVLEHPAEKHLLPVLLSLLPAAAQIGGLFQSGYSRQQELQADRQGVEFMKQAGFEAAGARRVLTLLERLPGAGGGGWWATHPNASERIAALRA